MYIPQDKLTQETRAEKQDTRYDKIKYTPVHFMGELHRNEWDEQQRCYGDHNARKAFVFSNHTWFVLE
ncbi:hypothetical protein GCM10028774_05260 [Spirosoma jeollabukense]